MTRATEASRYDSSRVGRVREALEALVRVRRPSQVIQHASAAGWTQDLVAFASLVVLMAMFGKSFAKLGIPSTRIYVTELALVLVAALAFRRCGLRGVVARTRRGIPIVPLLVFWVAGAVAALRGIDTFGVGAVIQDVGLVEYSVLLPVVAVVADTRRRGLLLTRTLVFAGVAATVVFALGFLLSETFLGPDSIALSAVSLYLALLILPVTAFLAHGIWPHRLELLAAGGALILMMLAVVRSALLGLLASVLVLGLLSPSRLRTLAVAAAVGAIAVGAALAAQSFRVGWQPTLQGPARAIMNPGFHADDGATLLDGGELVSGDAAAGSLSREIPRLGIAELQLHGLEVGKAYTVTLLVKPLEARRTFGYVGDTSGAGWGAKRWAVTPDATWQPVHKTLIASAEVERFAIWPQIGADQIRVDDIHVVPGSVPAAGSKPTEIPTTERRNRAGPALLEDLRNVFSGTGGDASGANTRWRLAYWRYAIEQTLDKPLAGVGFGHPASFHWQGVTYDRRRGDESDINDVTPPHNSFINIFYRAGLLGLVPLFVLLGVAVRRVLWLLRARSMQQQDRATMVALIGVLVFAIAIASFNVALENPYIGMFFWIPLGLLLVLPTQLRGDVAHD